MIITIERKVASRPFPYSCEGMVGFGRALLPLRQNYRDDFCTVKKITGVAYIRAAKVKSRSEDQPGFVGITEPSLSL